MAFVYHMLEQQSWDDVPDDVAEQLAENGIARDDGMGGYIVEEHEPSSVEDAMRDFGHDPND